MGARGSDKSREPVKKCWARGVAEETYDPRVWFPALKRLLGDGTVGLEAERKRKLAFLRFFERLKTGIGHYLIAYVSGETCASPVAGARTYTSYSAGARGTAGCLMPDK